MQLGKDRAKLYAPLLYFFASILLRVRLQSMQCVDQDERMFIHGVAMVGIADHQCINAMELRQDQLQHTQCVHGPQGMSRALTGEDRR